MSSALGSALRAERLRQGLSLRDLAERTGVSFASLSRIERGQGDPSLRNYNAVTGWLRSHLPAPTRFAHEPWDVAEPDETEGISMKLVGASGLIVGDEVVATAATGTHHAGTVVAHNATDGVDHLDLLFDLGADPTGARVPLTNEHGVLLDHWAKVRVVRPWSGVRV